MFKLAGVRPICPEFCESVVPAKGSGIVLMPEEVVCI
jgi:hypothetical protein